MDGLKAIGLIEDIHGHKGTVRVKPLNDNNIDIMNLKNVVLIDRENNKTSAELYEVRKYRRGRFLVKFCGLKWRNEIESFRNFVMAV
jgi:ribosomal 30S subunit maturation factor RimM